MYGWVGGEIAGLGGRVVGVLGEIEAVLMRCCGLHMGGWVGKEEREVINIWVGGRTDLEGVGHRVGDGGEAGEGKEGELVVDVEVEAGVDGEFGQVLELARSLVFI